MKHAYYLHKEHRIIMKRAYYLHKSLGFVNDYFGKIGPLVRTNIFRYYLMKLLGYRVTKIRQGKLCPICHRPSVRLPCFAQSEKKR